MALMVHALKSASSIALTGLAAAFLVPFVLVPVAGAVLRPFARAATKGGMALAGAPKREGGKPPAPVSEAEGGPAPEAAGTEHVPYVGPYHISV
ncbi:MAG: hypothetical protein HY900_08320 [Deltaproteobacteria bacterium]|nr:hypothetical protein [Deltaproteobacteria bacterium]